MLKTYACILIE